MAEDPAADLFDCELARADRVRLLARLADVDEDSQHARILAERAHVELMEAEMEATELGRPSSRTFLLRMTGRRGQLLRALEDRVLVARVTRNQMRWLQGSFDTERRDLRDKLTALPTPQELDEVGEGLKAKLGDPVPRALVAQIGRAVERQALVDSREALVVTRAAFDSAVDWLGRARRWTEEADGAFLGELGELVGGDETVENTVRVAGAAAEARASRLRSQIAMLSGLRGDPARTLRDTTREFGLAWARGMARAMLGSQDGLDACLRSAGSIREHLDVLDGVLKARGGM